MGVEKLVTIIDNIISDIKEDKKTINMQRIPTREEILNIHVAAIRTMLLMQ
jgi:preprotein translocase subunit Sss1